MNGTVTAAPSENPPAARRRIFAVAALLALAAVVAWHNSFRGALVYDDVPAIERNASIRTLWPPWAPLAVGRSDLTVSGRPFANWTLALNYAVGGTDVRGYHLFNLVLHLASALTLFGVVRRTLLQPVLRERFAAAALPLAGWVALLWLVHPLQTESVSYIIQRVEALMGLCYLLTLYCFIRAADSPSTRRWSVAAVLACVAGMASKEVMVSAPVIVWLYDRTFVAGGFRAALRQRRWLYGALAASWLVLLGLVLATGDRAGSAGFGGAVKPLAYALVQCEAVVRYLGLSLWPAPLVFDYGLVEVAHPAAVLPQALWLAALLAGTVVALWRRSPLGFLGAWFFAILAPSSSLIPIETEPIAEHRMYLPLAAIVTLLVFTVYRGGGRRALGWLGALAVVWAGLTIQRNRDYRDGLALWGDTVRKAPGNARAQNNLGSLLLEKGEVSRAGDCFAQALALQPSYASAHYNLGCALLRSGRAAEAVPHFAAALDAEPDFADAQVNWGEALLALGRPAEAAAHLAAAAAAEPEAADVRASLARAYQLAGRPDDAVREFRSALRLRPGDAALHFGLGNALVRTADLPAAAAAFQRAHELDPANVRIANNLANALLALGRFDEAIAGYEAILRDHPDDRAVRENLAHAREAQAEGARPP